MNNPNIRAEVGVTGMATMGSNLARNIARNGYAVAIHNRSPERTRSVFDEFGHEGTFIPTETLADFVAAIQRPRKVIVMVQAGTATDAVIDELVPFLDHGDVIVDAGNAHFLDTRRREATLTSVGLRFVGCGVSGGEEGALLGPSIMPGGTADAYDQLRPILTNIAAKVDGIACCEHVGPDGAGHFVKMVHNGIEYADMQLIAEAYDLLKSALGTTALEIADIFAEWNKGDLESFLIEITAEVLGHVDEFSGKPLVDVIVDTAEQKGTGRWTVQSALDLGVPVTGIAEAAFARALSASGPQRRAAVSRLASRVTPFNVVDRSAFIDDVRAALYASKVVAYSQGFDQLAAAGAHFGWGIDRGSMARIWRGGCIIRARFLERISEAYDRDPSLPLLLADPYFAAAVSEDLPAWRRVVAQAALGGVPVPALASSLSYYDAVRAERLPASLIQAQRDFFGAHTFERVDRTGSFHVRWSSDRQQVLC